VCSTTKVDLVWSIGADHVIDYTREDFTHGAERYDFILDNVLNHSLSRIRRALRFCVRRKVLQASRPGVPNR
jgi:NADPH:quinone reductase-like Zn-dependent oxidoreductase